MPEVRRPDGAVIHYEVFGFGYPVLLIAPGGLNSEIGFWERSRINPLKRPEFAGFRFIGMDQRHAGESWNAPMAYSYELTTGDQLAILDQLGVEKAHVWGGCIGVAHVTNLLKTAQHRFSAAVCQDPVGLDHTNSIDVFMSMFAPTLKLVREKGTEGVVQAALGNPMFVDQNNGGPFAKHIAGDSAFRERMQKMSADEYIRIIEAFAAGMWPNNPPFLVGNEEWIKTFKTPMLILPGNDRFHPTTVAYRLAGNALNARCLEVDCRSEENLPRTIKKVAEFLTLHTPKEAVKA
ncbi:MAG: alpha/beta hydrolase [Dehalococcoidia bacterium]|nr:alpha/beta hydrolase [Dehalococcoidia bacterium]